MATVAELSVPVVLNVRSGSQAPRATPTSALAAATWRSATRTSGRRRSRSMESVSGMAGTAGSMTGGAEASLPPGTVLAMAVGARSAALRDEGGRPSSTAMA